MKQGITITREYDHHDRTVVRITKRRGKLTLEEVSDLLRTEGWGEWNGYYAIVLNCSEGTLGGNGLYGYEEPKGDALDLYPLENFGDCPVCGQMTPPFQYCPNCGASWKEMDDTVEKRLAAMRMEERKSDIVLDRMSCVIVCEILDRYIEETKEDLPYMEETDRKREGALFDLVFSIRENLIKAYKERWDGKD